MQSTIAQAYAAARLRRQELAYGLFKARYPEANGDLFHYYQSLKRARYQRKRRYRYVRSAVRRAPKRYKAAAYWKAKYRVSKRRRRYVSSSSSFQLPEPGVFDTVGPTGPPNPPLVDLSNQVFVEQVPMPRRSFAPIDTGDRFLPRHNFALPSTSNVARIVDAERASKRQKVTDQEPSFLSRIDYQELYQSAGAGAGAATATGNPELAPFAAVGGALLDLGKQYVGGGGHSEAVASINDRLYDKNYVRGYERPNLISDEEMGYVRKAQRTSQYISVD